MRFMNWINRHLPNLFLAFLVLLFVLARCHGKEQCPEEPRAAAGACMANYTFHYRNMLKIEPKLCCGIDVETLRAFCSTYMSAVRCEMSLKRRCPSGSDEMDSALVNLEGTRESLMGLCMQDSFIESYAMHQSCLAMTGAQTEACFQTYIHPKTDISFQTHLNMKNKAQFCRKMRTTVSCVQRKVGDACGSEAARLSVILVKPMVWGSSDCDYSMLDMAKTTTSPVRSQSAFVSDESKDGGGKQVSYRNQNEKPTGGNPKNNKNNIGHALASFSLMSCFAFSSAVYVSRLMVL